MMSSELASLVTSLTETAVREKSARRYDRQSQELGDRLHRVIDVLNDLVLQAIAMEGAVLRAHARAGLSVVSEAADG